MNNETPFSNYEQFNKALNLFKHKLNIYYAMLILTLLLIIPSVYVLYLDLISARSFAYFVLASVLPLAALLLIAFILLIAIDKVKSEQRTFTRIYGSKFRERRLL